LFGLEQGTITSDDYYTPKWLFDEMGLTFDIDVASPPGGVPWIPAKRYFTMADDGLLQPWEGRVWMNPPFSNTNAWARKFTAHGHGVALIPVAKAYWFHELWESDAALVSLPSNFTFTPSGRNLNGCIFISTMLAAFGDECVEAVSRIGRVR
jgi:hypothetical protein